MPDINHTLVDRIEQRLQALGLSDRKASLNAAGTPDMIRRIRKGIEPRFERMQALADALGTTLDYLYGRVELTPAPKSASPIPPAETMSRDIPVFGTAIGADVGFWTEHDGETAIEQTDLNMGEVVDHFRRPPRLEGRRDIYGLYVAGDSMDPAYESGEGILVDPKKTPSIRDYVVVYLRDHSDEYAAAALIKRLVKRTGEYIELQQYNPPSVFRLDKSQYRELHRVVPWDEAVGF